MLFDEHIAYLSLELSASPLALLLGLELVCVALAASVEECSAFSGLRLKVPVGVALSTRTYW